VRQDIRVLLLALAEAQPRIGDDVAPVYSGAYGTVDRGA